MVALLGVPRIDGNFGNCDPKIKKIFEQDVQLCYLHKNFNLLIDSSPDIRTIFKNKVKSLDCVFIHINTLIKLMVLMI